MKRIRKGDTVEVITGEDQGLRGEVLRMLPKENRVVVSGINIHTKHEGARRAGRGQTQGGRIQFEAPLHASNVMPVCPVCDEPTRVGFEVREGEKVRICRKCDAVID